jgi:hypothetical protein
MTQRDMAIRHSDELLAIGDVDQLPVNGPTQLSQGRSAR